MTTENSKDFDELVNEAAEKVTEEVIKLDQAGQKWISANEIMKIFLEVFKPDVEPNEYICDEQVVIPLEWVIEKIDV